MMMRNIPTHYATKGLENGKVLKFDIRRPTKDEQLWNKQTEKTRNSTQECVIESLSEIEGKTDNKKQNKTNKDKQNATQTKRNKDQMGKQDSEKKRLKANPMETWAQKKKRGKGKTKQNKQNE